MKILVLNWQDIRNPLGGGAEVHLHQVFSRIAAAGHAVTVLVSAFNGSKPEEIIDGITIVRRGSRSLFNYVAPSAYRELRNRGGFDVVVDDMNKIPLLAQRYVREPVCGIVHHLFGSSVFREVNPLSAAYVSLTEWHALRRYRRDAIPFIAVSPSTRDDMIRRGYPVSLLHLVSLAVDHDRFQPAVGAKSVTPLIGYVGRIKKYKSIDHFIEALPRVLTMIPTLKVVIVGDGDDRPRLERLVESQGLKGTVEFTGYVDERRKVELLQSMWGLVMPSSKEGWGLTVTEANACGTPAIASDVPGLRDAVIDKGTGYLYPYGDRTVLAERILELVRDEPSRISMGKKAIEFSRQFTWDSAAEQTLSVLASIASSKS